MALLQTASIFLFAWLAWKVVRWYVTPRILGNLPGPTAPSFILGDLERTFNRFAFPFHQQLWRDYGAVVRLNAFFGSPLLYVYDSKALHHIVVKDQHVYEETSIFIDFNRLAFGEGLLSSLGEKHRQQRKILNPVFHTNHMRYMVPTFYRITHQLRKAIANEVKGGQREVDILNWMTRTALELVGQGGLGHSFDKLDRDATNPLAEDLKSLIPTASPLFFVVRFLPLVSRIGTPAFRRRMLELVPSQRIKRLLEIVDHLDKTSNTILSEKKAALNRGEEEALEKIDEGKDIMSVLLKQNMQASDEDRMSDKELLGHMSTLIFAAMETTSGALARILQLLAEHQDVQEKLRQEIIAARGSKEHIDYDELVSLPYLEAVCRESMRLHSPATSMTRAASRDIVLPLSTPIVGNDGTSINEILVPKGTGLVIGILPCNVNPAIWGEDAHEWKPERWLKPLPESVTEAHVPGVYSNLMTFLGGSRACIGFKFSQLEMKVVLAVLLETFRFSPSDKEIYWNWAGVQFPTVGPNSDKSEMPMRVELV